MRWNPNGQPLNLPMPGVQNPQGVGAGDVVARITQAFGIQPCNACEQRKKLLNDRLRFMPMQNPRTPR